MNATLKAIQALLKHPDIEMRLSALKVLGAIRSREPGIHRSLGEMLIAVEHPELFDAVLEAIAQTPHEQALKYLLKLLERGGDHQERVLGVIADIGPKAAIALKQQFDHVPSMTQARIVRVLPRLRTPQAHQLLVDACAHPDPAIVRATVHSLRDELPKYQPAEIADLHAKLSIAIKDRKYQANDGALCALIVAFGLLGDPKSKDRLLPFVAAEYSVVVRRHALLGLSRLDLGNDAHPDIVEALFPLLEEADYNGLVRHAIVVLGLLAFTRDDVGRLTELLENRHLGVRAFAIQALARMDSPANAQRLMEFLGGSEATLRDTAAGALATMPSAVPLIIKALDSAAGGRGAELVRILESHQGRLAPDRARALIKRMLDTPAPEDARRELYLSALRTLRPDILRKELGGMAEEAFGRGDYETVRRLLTPLDEAALLDDAMRYQLTLARLKASKKERDRAFRRSDFSLDHISELLAVDGKGFRQRLFAEPALDDEDFLYLGTHFFELKNEERRFGADLLRHVAARWPRKQSARAARARLANDQE